MLLVGSKSTHPAPGRYACIQPCVDPSPTTAGAASIRRDDVPADETRRETKRADGFHHEHREVPTAPAAEPERLARALDTLLAPPHVRELFLDAPRDRSSRVMVLVDPDDFRKRAPTDRGRRTDIGESDRPGDRAASSSEYRKRIGVRCARQRVIGQRRLRQLEGDRAVETQLGRRVSKVRSRRVVEDVVQPAKVRRHAA